MEAKETLPIDGNNKKEKKSIAKKILQQWKLWLILALLLGYIIFYFLHLNKLSIQKDQYNKAMDSLIIKSNQTLNEQEKQYLKNIASTLSWAIRSDMHKGNFEQISVYINQLVKEEGFQEILLANKDGVIILSTNKKYENTAIKEYFVFDYVEIKDIKIIENSRSSNLYAIAPIQGLNTQLATLLITYRPKAIK